ncbi:hypothetical protein ACIP5L_06225 [Streptomyces bacillaris]|uniref:hypothetical protein n=1 Tax=Streptomyces bacillaris TaxID=68179 RepID=UPI003801E73B
MLRPVLEELADGDPYERRIAVVAAAAGRDTEWTGPWRPQLRMLRRHPCRDVRDVAYAQSTAAE